MEFWKRSGLLFVIFHFIMEVSYCDRIFANNIEEQTQFKYVYDKGSSVSHPQESNVDIAITPRKHRLRIKEERKIAHNIHHSYNGYLQINNLSKMSRVASTNLNLTRNDKKVHMVNDQPYIGFIPNSLASAFQIPTLRGVLNFVNSSESQPYLPLLISVYSDYSGFLQCLWNCSGSLDDLVSNSPGNANYLFISSNRRAYEDAMWMHNKFESHLNMLKNKNRDTAGNNLFSMDQLHFATITLDELGNWIPEVLRQWMCLDHNCGYDQVRFDCTGCSGHNNTPLVVKRLDARYDWLPSPLSVFGNKVLPIKKTSESCSDTATMNLTGSIALTMNGTCSHAKQIYNCQKRGAVGVIVMETSGSVVDMHCAGSDCDIDIHIPATSIPLQKVLLLASDMKVTFQNTPSSNFFMAIDHHGNLQEVGWFLYPTMHFLAWQAQWFNYVKELEGNLSQASYIIDIFNDTVMHGAKGVTRTMSLPLFKEMIRYEKVELDMSLGCPGTNDRDCPHWDHTISLTVCTSYTCGLEIGRWISSFRRRIGRWLTDITPLLPLLNGPGVGKMISFTMKTAAWAMPWKPSLNLRFSGQRSKGDLYPKSVIPLYNSDGILFDQNYNTHFDKIAFNVSDDIKKVEIFAVITGHGSDENGCGEFCVTSHTFSVNGHNHSITFDTAGSPLGCANEVPNGSEPNEHGTWLYGRDGWCDGQNVKPWRIDVTNDVIGAENRGKGKSTNNTLYYRGYFQGKDPNPKKNPGVMIFASYLVLYSTY